MTAFVTQYWVEFGFGLLVLAFTAGYKRLFNKFKQVKKEQDAVKNGIKALLRDRIIQAYNHYVEKGCCPIYALENINALYKEYQDRKSVV